MAKSAAGDTAGPVGAAGPGGAAGDDATLAARLRAAEAALRERDAELRAFLEQTSDLVHVSDEAGRLRYANRAWRKALGVAPGAAGAPTLDAILAPASRAAYHDACAQVLADGASTTVTATFRGWDGTAVEVVGHLSRLALGDGPGLVQGLFHDVTARNFRAARQAHVATHDPLTNLANHAAFAQHVPLALARARRQGTRVAIVLIDLDEFHCLHETHGHADGDRALIALGDRLQRAVRADDLAARLGEDRFALVLERLRDLADARLVVERTLATIATPVLLADGAEYRPRASIGAALDAVPHDEPGDLFTAAERALFAAKRAGGATYVLIGAAPEPEPESATA